MGRLTGSDLTSLFPFGGQGIRMNQLLRNLRANDILGETHHRIVASTRRVAGKAEILVREQFGDRVAAIVEGLSDHLGPKGQKADWWDRKRAYVAHVEGADRSTQLVCAADKLDNLRATLADHARIGERVWSRFQTGRDGQAWYYGAVCTAIEAGPNADLRPVAALREAIGRLAASGKSTD